MIKILLLVSGGAIGTLARYGISEFTHKYFEGTFPLGTLVVNLSGSLLIGLLWGFWDGNNIPGNMRAFIFIGLLGGFTTFSSYAYESLYLFKDGDTKMALLNIIANNVLGLLLVFVGFIAARGLSNLIR